MSETSSSRHPNDPETATRETQKASLKLTEAERQALLQSIDSQIAEIDRRKGSKKKH
jgi:hypothetical protein